MVSPRTYIKHVNAAVRNGTHDRKIVVVKQQTFPSSGKHVGMAMTYHWKKKDEIIIPSNAPKTKTEVNKLERTSKGKELKRYFGLKKLMTEDEILKHELHHIHRPKAKEQTILKLDNKPLPARLPERRTTGFDKHR